MKAGPDGEVPGWSGAAPVPGVSLGLLELAFLRGVVCGRAVAEVNLPQTALALRNELAFRIGEAAAASTMNQLAGVSELSEASAVVETALLSSMKNSRLSEPDIVPLRDNDG